MDFDDDAPPLLVSTEADSEQGGDKLVKVPITIVTGRSMLRL